jgi:membrane dipeptidase
VTIPIVDGHLDLAENVTLFGRDLTRELNQSRAGSGATVSLPELRRGGIAIALATVTPGFLVDDVGPAFEPRSALYRTAAEARGHALAQLALYEHWARTGAVRLLKSVADLDDHLVRWAQDRTPGLVLLMESADAIGGATELCDWWRRGLRLIGLTFGDTRYGAGVAGGKPADTPGGLTPAGRALLQEMAALGFVWDVSHLTDEGIWQGLALDYPLVCASHANARALTPTTRHLSDDVLRALAKRDGVIGLVLYNGFLDPRWPRSTAIQVRLDDQLKRHASYIGEMIGWRHVGIGSDLDGGFGRAQSPLEIDTVADLHKVGAVVPAAAREAVLGGNWLRLLRSALPLSG